MGSHDLPLLRFPHLACQNGLQHAITTREGGVSRPPAQSFNLARKGGDDPAAVDENRRRLARALAPGRLVFLRQVHGNTVLSLKRPPAGEHTSLAGRGDAFITDQAGLLLTILVADCQAILLFDPRQRVVANVHSGWRGSIANVIGATVKAMVRDFGCRPNDLLAGVGPSLGPCCAEFINYRKEIPEAFWYRRVSKHHFDFWGISHDQLTAAGLAGEHITLSRICTRCASQRFFSYRAGHEVGRFAAVIGMRAEGRPG
ncbi:MAG: peptidoglycan editing factor PgeF [Desulfobacterales bacterium]|jgi:YfiH family protein